MAFKRKNDQTSAAKSGDSLGDMMYKIEDIAFGSVEYKLRLIAKVILGLFVLFALIGLVLTVLLMGSLGFFGVFVALVILVAFVAVGYAISACIYAYSNVVINSKNPPVIQQASEVYTQVAPAQVAKEKVETQEEFPEF